MQFFLPKIYIFPFQNPKIGGNFGFAGPEIRIFRQTIPILSLKNRKIFPPNEFWFISGAVNDDECVGIRLRIVRPRATIQRLTPRKVTPRIAHFFYESAKRRFMHKKSLKRFICEKNKALQASQALLTVSPDPGASLPRYAQAHTWAIVCRSNTKPSETQSCSVLNDYLNIRSSASSLRSMALYAKGQVPWSACCNISTSDNGSVCRPERLAFAHFLYFYRVALLKTTLLDAR